MELVPLLFDHAHIPIVNAEWRLMGMVTQSSLIQTGCRQHNALRAARRFIDHLSPAGSFAAPAHGRLRG